MATSILILVYKGKTTKTIIHFAYKVEMKFEIAINAYRLASILQFRQALIDI
jgi:hypothetical protein